MVIVSTSPVAPIIQAVSAPSIFAAALDACANAGEAIEVAAIAATNVPQRISIPPVLPDLVSCRSRHSEARAKRAAKAMILKARRRPFRRCGYAAPGRAA